MLEKIEKKHHPDKLKEIEQFFKQIVMQMDSSEAQVSSFDIGKPFDGKSFEEVDEYKETIYKALGVAFSNIFDNTKEIEKTNRIIAGFHNEKHGENETVRILASIEDKRSREIISRREKE
ncbi:MAG: hypothetical protein E4H16_04800, partial [Candidatus Atribacteria bacterium]